MDGDTQVANLMKVLAHPVRLQILEALGEETEACVCHLERRLNQRQAYISQHLAKLREVGLVHDRRDGLNIFYALSVAGIDDLLSRARGLVSEIAHGDGVRLTFAPIRVVPPEICNCPKCSEKVATVIEGP